MISEVWALTRILDNTADKGAVPAAQSCPTLCDPKDCSPPGSSAHGDSDKGNGGYETDHQPRLHAWDKRSDLVHWEDPEGSGGEGGGRGDWDGEHM